MAQLVTEPPRCLRVEEAARLLNVGRTTAYDLIRSGRLRSVKIGRRRLVPRDALDALLASLKEIS
ncbi:helix-turn-helix domain-containing protein [Micromonospora sp. IBHARD004]|uniref:helix-turn-helix domain-containing protein n=1 Tax=Micromonospora sp. IBHARD004 TaxID=3457764 RepID=UPI004058EE3D